MFLSRSLLAVVLAVHVSSSQAAAPGVNRVRSNATSAAVQVLDDLRIADALARYGEQKKDALALIVAAQMAINTQAQAVPLNLKGRSDAGAPAGNATMTESPAVAWLARARALALDRPDLIALVNDLDGGVRMRGSGRVTYGLHLSRIRAGQVDQYEIAFRGGEPAAVAIRGDEDSKLDLYVYDENGERVCADTTGGEEKICRWTPKWSGRFVVRVVNRGPSDEYRLMTNQ